MRHPSIGDFNSIKVRLKHEIDRYLQTVKLFQFHKGTIKTKRVRIRCARELFQFHKGTIKTVAGAKVYSSTTLISIP